MSALIVLGWGVFLLLAIFGIIVQESPARVEKRRKK